MKRDKFIQLKQVINWPVVVAEVNRRLGVSYSRNYIRNIWTGLQTSEPIKTALNDILKGVVDVKAKEK